MGKIVSGLIKKEVGKELDTYIKEGKIVFNVPEILKEKIRKMKTFVGIKDVGIKGIVESEVYNLRELLEKVGLYVNNTQPEITSLVILGSSGIGKTTMLKKYLKEYLKKKVYIINLGEIQFKSDFFTKVIIKKGDKEYETLSARPDFVQIAKDENGVIILDDAFAIGTEAQSLLLSLLQGRITHYEEGKEVGEIQVKAKIIAFTNDITTYSNELKIDAVKGRIGVIYFNPIKDIESGEEYAKSWKNYVEEKLFGVNQSIMSQILDCMANEFNIQLKEEKFDDKKLEEFTKEFLEKEEIEIKGTDKLKELIGIYNNIRRKIKQLLNKFEESRNQIFEEDIKNRISEIYDIIKENLIRGYLGLMKKDVLNELSLKINLLMKSKEKIENNKNIKNCLDVLINLYKYSILMNKAFASIKKELFKVCKEKVLARHYEMYGHLTENILKEVADKIISKSSLQAEVNKIQKEIIKEEEEKEKEILKKLTSIRSDVKSIKVDKNNDTDLFSKEIARANYETLAKKIDNLFTIKRMKEDLGEILKEKDIPVKVADYFNSLMKVDDECIDVLHKVFNSVVSYIQMKMIGMGNSVITNILLNGTMLNTIYPNLEVLKENKDYQNLSDEVKQWLDEQLSQEEIEEYKHYVGLRYLGIDLRKLTERGILDVFNEIYENGKKFVDFCGEVKKVSKGLVQGESILSKITEKMLRKIFAPTFKLFAETDDIIKDFNEIDVSLDLNTKLMNLYNSLKERFKEVIGLGEEKKEVVYNLWDLIRMKYENFKKEMEKYMKGLVGYGENQLDLKKLKIGEIIVEVEKYVENNIVKTIKDVILSGGSQTINQARATFYVGQLIDMYKDGLFIYDFTKFHRNSLNSYIVFLSLADREILSNVVPKIREEFKEIIKKWVEKSKFSYIIEEEDYKKMKSNPDYFSDVVLAYTLTTMLLKKVEQIE